MTWWQNLALILGALGGFEFIKWLFNRKTERRLNDIEVKQQEQDLDEKRITELHASIDKANELNDNLLKRLSAANAAVDKHIDRNRELSDRLYHAEQEVNRVNDKLTEEQSKTADLELVNNGVYNASGFVKVYQSGIESAITDNNIEPVYYNLQGVRIDAPASAGIYIMRKGTETSKVFIK